MKVQQILLKEDNWKVQLETIGFSASLFLCFVSTSFKYKENVLKYLKNKFPQSVLVGCSSGGEISEIAVSDKSLSLTAISFQNATFKKVAINVNDVNSSEKAGYTIGRQLNSEKLKHVIVFGDSENVNGSDLVTGLKSNLQNVSVSGGLASNALGLSDTFVLNNYNIVNKTVVAVGFYGDNLIIGNASRGGWGSFGIERLVTKAEKNILYEIDGVPALTFYKKFLGDKLYRGFKSPDLTFSLSMRTSDNLSRVVRSIKGVNEADQSLILGGNIYENALLRLMKFNADRLINGAEASAKAANKHSETGLAILISCIGRKNFLKQLVEEEVEVVRETLGERVSLTGFYALGEIGPYDDLSPCELHNQTMTITTLSEC
ncbi:FIST signal transduction protein [Neotamlana laminarinivorans]|uniref:FIST C-terminal domain-containing protein n=1 Tax=Neotamlana laminarinivorans TaxID=2883124 RepID=A0A9X1I1F9_9FLAO|nr:FIST N-terminal domain-containing protein [Tamlana laminarinivorans]MCB4799220.1 FIST C-terminal domain-containing protein [Tamlana laminarinivorans]